MIKSGFVKKNVGTFTLGERLSKIRSERRISLGEISKSARIQSKYLEYLENGEYEKLPADVYVKGFLRSYAQYLGMDENYLIKSFEREKEIYNNIRKEDPQKKFFKPLKFSSLVITPKIIVATVVIFFVGLGFFYLYRELSMFVSSPRLVISEPQNNFVTEENIITVEGITEKDAKIFINDQQIVVDENGKFSENVVVQPGLNKITVKAVNRFDKNSEKVIVGESKVQNESRENNPIENQNQEPAQNN